MKHTIIPPTPETTHPAMYRAVNGHIYITDASGRTLFYVGPHRAVGRASGGAVKDTSLERLPAGTTLTFTQE